MTPIRLLITTLLIIYLVFILMVYINNHQHTDCIPYRNDAQEYNQYGRN